MSTKLTRYELQRLHNEVVTAARLWAAAKYGTKSREVAAKRYDDGEAAFADALIARFEK